MLPLAPLGWAAGTSVAGWALMRVQDLQHKVETVRLGMGRHSSAASLTAVVFSL